MISDELQSLENSDFVRLPGYLCHRMFAVQTALSRDDVGDLSYYVDQATKVEYPDVEYPTLDEVTQAHAPITVDRSGFHILSKT